jgi:hypothetical protein
LQGLGTLLQYQGRISLIPELSPFLYRDRSRIGPGHPARIHFSSPATYTLGVYESSAGCSSWNDIGIIFLICKQNVGVAHARQLKALSGWANPISHDPSIGPRQCGNQNYNGSLDIGVHGGDRCIKKRPQAIGKCRAGWTTKIHMVAADARSAITLELSPGQAGDAPQG